MQSARDVISPSYFPHQLTNIFPHFQSERLTWILHLTVRRDVNSHSLPCPLAVQCPLQLAPFMDTHAHSAYESSAATRCDFATLFIEHGTETQGAVG